MRGAIGYCDVNNIQQSLQALLNAGAQVQQEVRVGGGMLITWVKNADGNIAGLRQGSKL